MKAAWIFIAAVLTASLTLHPVAAQKGVGEPKGVAQMTEEPTVTTFFGIVEDVKIGPCENTTGPSPLGVHLMLGTDEMGPIDLHLGPMSAVDYVAELIATGDTVMVQAFRTSQLTDGAYVAKTLTLEDKLIELRDDDLRPNWARGADRGAGQGKGQGMGAGKGAGQKSPGWCWE